MVALLFLFYHFFSSSIFSVHFIFLSFFDCLFAYNERTRSIRADQKGQFKTFHEDFIWCVASRYKKKIEEITAKQASEIDNQTSNSKRSISVIAPNIQSREFYNKYIHIYNIYIYVLYIHDVNGNFIGNSEVITLRSSTHAELYLWNFYISNNIKFFLHIYIFFFFNFM